MSDLLTRVEADDDLDIPLDDDVDVPLEQPADEPEIGALAGTRSLVIPTNARCEEASPLSKESYVPCLSPADALVRHERDGRDYYMCAPCASHNTRNRGAKLLAHKNAPLEQPAVPADVPFVPDTPTPAQTAALVPVMQILPADFDLPRLIKFIPNPALKTAADEATAYALSLNVVDAEGIERADLALGTLRASLRAITETFQEPAALAHSLHAGITSKRAEWLAAGDAAVKTVGSRIWMEKRRLDAIAAEAARKAQEKANQEARETARRNAAAAEKAKAPAPIVEQLRREAETVTAPPVAAQIAAPVMKSTTVTTTWKARLKGSPAEADPHPDIADLTPLQHARALELLAGIIAGKDPIAAIAIDWSYLDKRAKADKSTLAISGIESFEDGGVRSKVSRSR